MNNNVLLSKRLNCFGRDKLRQNGKPVLFSVVLLMFLTAVLQVIVPLDSFQSELLAVGVPRVSQNQHKTAEDTRIKMKHDLRNGLFKPSRRVSANSMTDKTIEKIFNSLKLQCVMTMAHEPVAYIVLKDGQMKKCKMGDSVKDMFTVVDIQSDGVMIDILGHKLLLNK